MAVELVQGDTAPTLIGTITEKSTGNPVDLTNCTVYLQMRKADDKRYSINATCTITDAVNGKVSYSLGANDLNTQGTYLAQFEVHYPDTKTQTTYDTVEVTVRRQ